MKKIITLITVLFLASCSCKKVNSQNHSTANLTSDCPKNGTCSLELFKGKSMLVNQDEFNKPYYELEENAATTVLKYTYSRTVKGNIQDAGYREEIVFEINNDQKNIILTDDSLQNTKMLYGRFCYCKGQTGYYKVSKGNLNISKKPEETAIALDFKIDAVPQIITAISLVIK